MYRFCGILQAKICSNIVSESLESILSLSDLLIITQIFSNHTDTAIAWFTKCLFLFLISHSETRIHYKVV